MKLFGNIGATKYFGGWARRSKLVTKITKRIVSPRIDGRLVLNAHLPLGRPGNRGYHRRFPRCDAPAQTGLSPSPREYFAVKEMNSARSGKTWKLKGREGHARPSAE